MNEEHSVKETEISLVDLMFFCLDKWRIILVVMLFCGLMAGGYKYRNALLENRVKQQELLALEEQKETKKNEKEKQENKKEQDNETIESYRQIITECEHSLRRQENYLKQSVIMRLDPYCISTGTLNYYMTGENDTDILLSAYQLYITEGMLAKELHAANPEISVEDLRYLISFTNGTDVVYELGKDQVIHPMSTGDAMFRIQIRMPDSDLCDVYLKQTEKSMAEYTYRLRTEMAEHEMLLLSSAQAEITDLGIRDYQNALQSTHITAVKNVETLKNELAALLSADSEDMTKENELEEEITEDGAEDIVLEDPESFGIKFAIMGAAAGTFISCFVCMICYIMNGKLQNTEDIKEIYKIPILGAVYIQEKKGKFFGVIDKWIYRARCGVYADISFDEQIKMVLLNVRAAIDNIASKEKAKRIMLAGTIPEKETAGLCGKLFSEMQEISFSAYQQMPFQSLTLQELKDYDAILFLEKRGISPSKLIMQERKLALTGNITILGAIILA